MHASMQWSAVRFFGRLEGGLQDKGSMSVRSGIRRVGACELQAQAVTPAPAMPGLPSGLLTLCDFLRNDESQIFVAEHGQHPEQRIVRHFPGFLLRHG